MRTEPTDGLDLEATYERYAPMVLRRCRSLLPDEDLAADTMQDTFVRFLDHRDALRSAAVASYLFQTATHLCLNRIRNARRRPESHEELVLLEIASMEDLEGQTAARRLLGRIFGAEPASTQVMAVLHLVDGLTLEETAAAVGLSVSGVRKRLRRLRERLGVEHAGVEP